MSPRLQIWLLCLVLLPVTVPAKFTYTTNNGALTITGYNGQPGNLIIPGAINGYPVTSIAAAAFTNQSTLTCITIPNSVTNVGDGAFYQCSNLTNTTVGNGVISLGTGVFYGCSSLRGIYFQGNAPSVVLGVFVLDDNATVYYLPGTSGWSSPFGGFGGARPAVMLNPPNPAGSLQVTIASTAAINNGAQWQVDGGVPQPSGAIVSGLSVGSHTVSFSSLNGWLIPTNQSVVISADSTTTATSGSSYYQLAYTTNNGTITIVGYITPGISGTVVLPGTISGLPVTGIGTFAFLNRNLINVTIPSSVAFIGNQAFQGNNNLKGIYFQGNAPITGGANLFLGEPNATVYYLPGTSGWSSTFGGQPTVMLNPPTPAGSLQVTLSPTTITNAMQWQVDGGVAQFSGAIVSGLSAGNHTVTFSPTNGWAIPASQLVAVSADSIATASGSYAQLAYLTNNGVIAITGYKYPGPNGAVALPSTINGLQVVNIWSQIFQNATAVTGITIPNSVTNIENAPYAAFSGYLSLAAIIVDTNNPAYSSLAGVLFNRDQTTLVEYPKAGAGTYTIPDTVIHIGNGAFGGCSGLTNIIIGPNVDSIGDSAFANCSSLTSVTIPNSVIGIGNYAFASCSSLTNLTIGTNVTTILDDAFIGCPSLAGIYFQGNAPNIFSDIFLFENNVTVYYLPWTTGWGTPGTPFDGVPTALWLPQAQNGSAGFGGQVNQFGFNITWAKDTVVVVDACTNLTNPVWTPVGTNILTGGSSCFRDPDSTNYSGRFYRLRSQ